MRIFKWEFSHNSFQGVLNFRWFDHCRQDILEHAGFLFRCKMVFLAVVSPEDRVQAYRPTLLTLPNLVLTTVAKWYRAGGVPKKFA